MRSLLDTSVLVYADAGDDPVKQRIALGLITSLRLAGNAVISTQVLQEFVNVALRKLHLPQALIRERVAFYRGFDTVPASADLIVGALDLHVLHGLSFYDALIVQAAAAVGCERVLSEDMQHGGSFRGVRIENPFAAAPVTKAATRRKG